VLDPRPYSRVARFAASLLAIYFVAFQIFVANPDLYVSESLSPIFVPLANILNLNVAWEFFSPDPGNIMYLNVSVKKNGTEIAREEMPPREHSFFIETRYLRRAAIMRYMLMDYDRLNTIFIPWLCQRYPEGTEVEIALDTYSFPSIEDVAEGRRRLNELRDNDPKILRNVACLNGEIGL
jgi:hypothetical protein